MASIKKRGSSWHVLIKRLGIRKSGTFSTRLEADQWAATTEADIIAGKNAGVADKTFGELLDEYARRVSVTKRGERWERMRINLVNRDEIAKIKLIDLNAAHIADWRDRRLTQVSPASVRREWVLLSHALNIAMKEWKWIPENPMKEVRRPASPPARDRRISQEEIDRLMLAFGDNIGTVMGRVGQAFLFAIETGMRAGEIAGLTWDRVYMERRFCTVSSGKTQAAKRDVPLSAEALRLLARMKSADTKAVFDLTTQQIDVLFRRAKDKALVTGLHFHDTRAEAITRLAQKLDILTLARMVGHRDLRMLQIYFRESAEDTAKKL